MEGQSGYQGYGEVKFASPLRSYTVFDEPQLFPRDKARLERKREIERLEREESQLVIDEEDGAPKRDGAVLSEMTMAKISNDYQFVGVVNGAKDLNNVEWFARKKPKNEENKTAGWSLRMVYADGVSTARDMLLNRVIDLYGEYRPDGRDKETGRVLVKPDYSVRKKSPMNLWNFRPVQFLTDKSGMKTRERRIKPGLYTDGEHVFEGSYDYLQGKNVMRKYESFEGYARSKHMDQQALERLQSRMATDQPDLVIEKTSRFD